MPILKYLLDTNVVSDWMRREPEVVEWLEAHEYDAAICAPTVGELRYGIELKSGKARRDLELRFAEVLETFAGCVWVFDEAAAFEWARLMAEFKNQPVPYGDSLIAAIARSMGVRVVTRNVRDFRGCETVDPWTGEERSAERPS